MFQSSGAFRFHQTHWRLRSVALTLAAAMALAAVALASAAPQAQAKGHGTRPLATLPHLGPAPQRCFQYGSSDNICQGPSWPYPPNANYLYATYYGTVYISPHIVAIGQDMTAKAVPDNKGTPFWTDPPGKIVAGCRDQVTDRSGTVTRAADTFCTWKATEPSAYPPDDGAPGGGYSEYDMTFCGFFGCAASGDFYYVLPHKRAISGMVYDNTTSSSGHLVVVPVANAEIQISGPGGGTAVTDKAGFYNALVDPGQYTVHLTGIDGQGATGAPITCSPGAPDVDGSGCDIDVRGSDGDADFKVVCGIDETIDGWKLTGDCPPADDAAAGATDVDATPPPGSPIDVDRASPNGSDPDTWPLPVEDATDRNKLLEPVELPDLDIAGLHLEECAIDDDGLFAGQASFDFGPVSGLAEDLTVSSDGSASADWLQLQFGGFSVETSDAAYEHGTFKAGTFTLGLPGALGGGSLEGQGLSVGPGGVTGTISPQTFTIGDLKVELNGAGLEKQGEFVINSAKLVLPGYLGGATLSASGLRYQSNPSRLVGSVGVRIKDITVGTFVSLASLKNAAVTLTFDTGVDGDPPAYTIEGGGNLDVEQGGRKVMGIDGEFKLASVQCSPTPPGPCVPGHAVFLQKAGLGLALPSAAIPILDTGLELTGVSGYVKGTEHPPVTIQSNGTLSVVSYTFTLGAGLRTVSVPGVPPLFDGTVKGSISTDGNLGLTVPTAKIFGLLDFSGYACMINNGDDLQGACADMAPGYYIGGTLSASRTFSVAGCHGGVAFTITGKGQFVHRGTSQGYVEANAGGELDANLDCVAVKLHAGAAVSGSLGLFSVQGGGTVYGIKLSANYNAGSGTHTISHIATIFIAPNRGVVLNAGRYTEITSGSVQPDAVRLERFSASASDGPLPARSESSALPARRGEAGGAPGTSNSSAVLASPRVLGTNGCAYAVALLSAQARERAASEMLTDPGARFPDDDSGTEPIPTFDVSSNGSADAPATPCIAANDAAAIQLKDPSTNAGAVTVSSGAYGAFGQKSPDTLTYSRYSPAFGSRAEWKQNTKSNRRAACGKDPFFNGHQPGPTDLMVDEVGEIVDGTYTYTSCDEYPFASTTNGGSSAIIRGVPLSENSAQGRALSKFYRENAVALQQNSGQFNVCVDGTIGAC